jgi:hypothetical protein
MSLNFFDLDDCACSAQQAQLEQAGDYHFLTIALALLISRSWKAFSLVVKPYHPIKF